MKITSPLSVILLTATLAATATHAAIVAQLDEAAGKTSFDGNIVPNLIRDGEPTLELAETSHPSYNGFPTSGLNDGSAASNSNLTYFSIRNNNGGGSLVWLPVTITFTLTGSATGYDITSIQSIAGWGDSYLGDQEFQLLLSVNGGEFADYGIYANTTTLNGGNNSTMTTLTDDSGVIASGVTGIQFIFMNPESTQGGDGGTVIHELQAFGTPTIVPEPQVWSLIGAGFVLVAANPRRRRG